jgi:hypothetical protein
LLRALAVGLPQGGVGCHLRNMGFERVRKAKVQRLCTEFEMMPFKDGETVVDFALRLMGLVNDLWVLSDTVQDVKALRKLLRVVPPRYMQAMISIETLMDFKMMSIEKVTGRLQAMDDRYREPCASVSGAA